MVSIWWRIAFALSVLVHLVVLYLPSSPGTGSMPPGTDKVVHAVIFGAVAVTAVRQRWRPGVVAAVLLAHAVGSELIQHFALSQRSGDPWDVAADALGTILGVYVAARGRSVGPS